MRYRVGLSGGIGSGKSTVASLFHEQGITVIDSDAISHQITRPDGEAIPLIRAAFGAEYLDADGALDRAKMRGLVFSESGAKKMLESILHPLIRSRMLAQAQEPVHSHYLLLVVPLLFEVPNYRELANRTLVVDCAEETQVTRAIQRSALKEQEVRAIMAQQIPRAKRLQLADDVIHNDGCMQELLQQVMQLHRYYLARSSELALRPSRSN
jgi:dephospho-CoA kinase